ncbi:MAG TPA: DUF2934 domain-containing protein [Bryobacteraceae bacterium]|jgi:hypothetical protein|nr:DUF2934 domain-containing protein [Bryobacteraceae bacterium]
MPNEAAAAARAEEPVEAPAISHGDIEKLAYALWEARGCPIGSPEEDWHSAEVQLQSTPTGR